MTCNFNLLLLALFLLYYITQILQESRKFPRFFSLFSLFFTISDYNYYTAHSQVHEPQQIKGGHRVPPPPKPPMSLNVGAVIE